MKTVNFGQTDIVGIELRTTNENGKAFEEIPVFWQKFYQEGIVEKINNKTSSDIYAVYTNFENKGENNLGVYSLIIGCSVNSIEDIPKDLVSTVIPKSNYSKFESEIGKPEKIGNVWQKIWLLSDVDKNFNRKRTYISEFELYETSGNINIFIGMKDD